MGLFDNLVGAVTGALGGGTEGQGAQNILGNLLQQGGTGQSGAIIGQLLGGLGGAGAGTAQDGAPAGGGMQQVLESLAANGLGEHVSSWLSANASSLPITPQQIHDALGSDQVQQMASATGLPVGDFLKHLADHLPQAAAEASGAAPANG